MAKMKSRGARLSRPPPGSCNQNANPPLTTNDTPDDMISTAKSILDNEICNEVPHQPRPLTALRSGLGRAELGTSLPLSSLNFPQHPRKNFRLPTGIFLLRPETYRLQARTGNAALRSRSERHRKKRTLSQVK